MYKYVLFDLDGTLTDSKPGIINCLKFALDKIGANLPESELNEFIGPPLHVSMLKRGYSAEVTDRFIAAYRERFSKKGIYENTLYPNATFTLKKIKEMGKKIILATSKPLVFAQRILDHFGLTDFFDRVVGATMDGSLSEKRDIIEAASRELDTAFALMVGDRRYDVEGAASFKIDSVGVTYGYGSVSELRQAGATYIIDEITQLIPILS